MQTEPQTDITYVLSDLNNRIRTTENRQTLFAERLLVVNKNMIEEYKKMMTETRLINDDLREMKREIETIKVVLQNIARDIGSFAKKEDVKVVEKYVELWNPMNFVTEKQLETALKTKRGK